MELIKNAIIEWLKEILVGGILSNLSGLFDNVNERVGEIAAQVGTTPQAWNTSIYSMIRSLSDNVMVPIAGVVLSFVMTLEFIQLITEKNNMGDVDTWMIFKWVLKTACAVLIVTNTWNIVMAVFELGQSVVNNAAGVIVSDATLDISEVIVDLEDRLNEMEVGPLFGLWFQTLFVGLGMRILSLCIFVIVYGRMIEIYLTTSIAPVPMATMLSKESGTIGQNYLRSLFALALQAFLIIVCVAIYAALVGHITVSDDVSYAIWTCMGYTVLLCFTLFKTGSLSKSLLRAG